MEAELVTTIWSHSVSTNYATGCHVTETISHKCYTFKTVNDSIVKFIVNYICNSLINLLCIYLFNSDVYYAYVCGKHLF
jgi:hypothetical protein